MNKKSIIDYIKEFQNAEITFIGGDYKGKGRPKKSDYVTCKLKDYREYWVTQTFLHSFDTTYTTKGI